MGEVSAVFAVNEDMTIVETINILQDDDKAEQLFMKARWPDGIRCPKCDSSNVYECIDRKPTPFRWP